MLDLPYFLFRHRLLPFQVHLHLFHLSCHLVHYSQYLLLFSRDYLLAKGQSPSGFDQQVFFRYQCHGLTMFALNVRSRMLTGSKDSIGFGLRFKALLRRGDLRRCHWMITLAWIEELGAGRHGIVLVRVKDCLAFPSSTPSHSAPVTIQFTTLLSLTAPSSNTFPFPSYVTPLTDQIYSLSSGMPPQLFCIQHFSKGLVSVLGQKRIALITLV